jgi:hypothetical protein
LSRLSRTIDDENQQQPDEQLPQRSVYYKAFFQNLLRTLYYLGGGFCVGFSFTQFYVEQGMSSFLPVKSPFILYE